MKVNVGTQQQLTAPVAVRAVVSVAFYFGYWFSRSRA